MWFPVRRDAMASASRRVKLIVAGGCSVSGERTTTSRRPERCATTATIGPPPRTAPRHVAVVDGDLLRAHLHLQVSTQGGSRCRRASIRTSRGSFCSGVQSGRVGADAERVRRSIIVRRRLASTAASECARSRDAVSNVTRRDPASCATSSSAVGCCLAAQLGAVSLRELGEAFRPVAVELPQLGAGRHVFAP
jgi:hypothetical protein